MKEFADLLYDSGVLRFGDFQLKSGRRSPFFLNFGHLHTGPQLDALGRAFAARIATLETAPDVILGPPYKAITMAAVTTTALWREHGLVTGFLTFRKESKAHGEGGDFLGHSLIGGESIVMVDDVMTSGATKVEAMELIERAARSQGLEPPRFEAVVVGVDRQEREGERTAAEVFSDTTGVPVYSVATIRELVKCLRPRLDAGQQESLDRYLG